MFLTQGVRSLLFINIGLLLVPFLVGRHEILVEFLGLHFLNSQLFSPLQLVSHMFLHANFTHLLFNMFGLVMFGSWLERVWGLRRFLIFYFVCGIGAGLLYMGVNYFDLQAMIEARNAFDSNPNADDLANFLSKFYGDGYREYLGFIDKFSEYPQDFSLRQNAVALVNKVTQIRVDGPMIGASGAVFGVILAFGMMFPNAELLFFPLPIPVKAKYVVLFYGASALFGAIHKAPGDNVAHYAHLGGMLFGFIMMRVYKKW
jgi:membrane associated rhomboid family serine protease